MCIATRDIMDGMFEAYLDASSDPDDIPKTNQTVWILGREYHASDGTISHSHWWAANVLTNPIGCRSEDDTAGHQFKIVVHLQEGVRAYRWWQRADHRQGMGLHAAVRTDGTGSGDRFEWTGQRLGLGSGHKGSNLFENIEEVRGQQKGAVFDTPDRPDGGVWGQEGWRVVRSQYSCTSSKVVLFDWVYVELNVVCCRKLIKYDDSNLRIHVALDSAVIISDISEYALNDQK